MKPSSDLPFRVLASLLGILAIVVLAGVLWPRAVAVLLAGAAGISAVGGIAVANEARRRRNGWTPGVEGSRARVSAAAVGAAVAGLAAALGAPGLFVKDAGELASSALILGVAHPTGFPTFCLMGRAFGYLPFGDLFFRMNLLSALALGAAAAAAWAVAREVAGTRDGGRSRTVSWAALAAPLVLLASPTVWLHGTTTEVYALSAAGMTAAIGCALVGARLADARWMVLAAFLVGLGTGGHVTWPVEAGLVLAIATAALLARRPSAWRVVPASAVALLAGALVVLYLPVAASRDPVMNWGDPSTAAGVWAHLTGERIRQSFAGRMGTIPAALMEANVRMALGTLAEGTAAVWPLAAIGMAWTARRDLVSGAALLAVLSGDLLFASRINPMGIRDLQVLVPSTVVLGILAAAGVEALAAGVRRRGLDRWAPLVVATALGAPLLQGVLAPADRDMTVLQAPREIAATFLAGIPPGATVLSASDDLSAMLAGLQAVDGVRPDVLALVKQHLSDTAYVSRALRAHGGRPGEEGLRTALASAPFEAGGEPPGAALLRMVDLASLRGPVWVETGEARVDVGIRERLVPGFPASVAGGTRPAQALQAAVAAADAAAARAGESDRWARAFLGSQVGGLAIVASGQGSDATAIELLALALRLNPRDPRAMNNLGALLADGGMPGEALPWLRRAVEEDPSYVRGWRTLSRVAAAAGQADESARAAARAEALGP